ncbi:hypothetical protein GCM10027566_35430 [Arachidicoccus ginsenosidivorans]|jgi:hypothetical protein|uniref:MmcB family DNA repair protein n=1 Tax=Arachidicoccus ginsenosidivorans TaxID=496057 RepID=A0A5B8VL31_9BACT|nr:hypothetical protein [Arachidicoccus ginsenosidivorans]QEC71731.1 hypothetical protein FSB73_08690 [Arachidicoccus ginsenosidivorans]
MFETELDMSLKFEQYLKANFGSTFIKECQGLFGVPDFLFYVKQKKETSVIAFELKLKNWQRAAKQAFRYKMFSNTSYVVLPEATVGNALANIELFQKYNIGLAKFDMNGSFAILFKPKPTLPYSEELNKKVLSSVDFSRKRTRNAGVFFD